MKGIIKIIIVMLIVVCFDNPVYSRDKNISIQKDIKKTITTNSVNNLINGIQSDNPGLKRSSIFFAGKYEIKQTVQYLIEALNKERDHGTKILIALSLFKIGDLSAINAIREIASKDKNRKVRHMLSAVYNEFLISTSQQTAKNSKDSP